MGQPGPHGAEILGKVTVVTEGNVRVAVTDAEVTVSITLPDGSIKTTAIDRKTGRPYG